MESKIYLANVYHSRVNPMKHTFQYAVYYFILDLDELESGKLDNPLFGYNKSTRVISVRNIDYMGSDNKPIKEKVLDKLKSYQKTIIQQHQPNNQNNNEHIINLNIDSIKSIKLITNPRYFNYSFNPVNFYYCFNETNELLQIAVEINNTFGETHLYYPSPTEFRDVNLKYPFKNSVDSNPYLKRYSSTKDFHVSPFNSLDGAYDFYFSDINKCFDIRINLMSSLDNYSLDTLKNNGNGSGLYDYIILTRLWSTEKPLPISSYGISKVLFTYPVTTFMTLPRILYQAGKLHWVKKLKIYSKPNPPLENTTVVIKPSANELSALDFFLGFLKEFKNISICLNLPDGQNIVIDNRDLSTTTTTTTSNQHQQQPQPQEEIIKIQVLNYEFFWKLFIMNKTLNSESRGFSSKAIGMAYMCEDFKCDNLPALLNQLCDLSISSGGNNSSSSSSSSSSLEDRKRIWSDLSDFINFDNVYSTFLYNQENQTTTPFNYLLNNNFDSIINEIGLTEDGSNQSILEIEPKSIPSSSFGNYLINNGYLGSGDGANNSNSNKLTILISSKELYGQYTSSNSPLTGISNVVVLNMDYHSFLSLEENKNKFDKIISIQGIQLKLKDKELLPFKSCLKSNNGSKLFIQQINNGGNGNGNGNGLSALKPIRSSSFKNNYYKMIDQVGKKYWALMANFQHNPFYLESRYIDLMKILNLGSESINSHIYDENSNTATGGNGNNRYGAGKIEILDTNIILNTIENWIKQCTDNQSLFSIKIQENAMRQGCLLKMNTCEINEIHRGTIFQLSFLYASFKYSNWSISKFTLLN